MTVPAPLSSNFNLRIASGLVEIPQLHNDANDHAFEFPFGFSFSDNKYHVIASQERLEADQKPGFNFRIQKELHRIIIIVNGFAGVNLRPTRIQVLAIGMST